MKIYLSEYIAPSARKRLEEKFEIVDNFDHPEELDGIIVRRVYVTREIIKNAKKLKFISMHGVGLDTIDMEAAEEYGIPVQNVPGESAESVAELAVAFIMAASRKLKYVDSGLQNGKFQFFGQCDMIGNEVSGKKLGLVGSGHIAGKVADIMKYAFHNEVYCFNPRQSAENLDELGYQKIETLEELFHICDYVSIHVPLTDSTRGMIGKSAFDAANPGLILVNTARGGIVDEKALYEALTSGKIHAAAADVFAEEIPCADDPLLHLQNFIATLHIGGSTEEALERVSNKAVDHLIYGIANTVRK